LHVGSLNHAALAGPEMALLRSVGMQMGFALENLRLREEARRADALAALVQEMHHRIKNNLQTVADLLSLEMSASPSPVARKSLRDSVGRIKSIAAVHELLSLEQLRLTDITMLARQVCDISLKHFVRPDRRIAAEIAGPPIYLPSKQATALALIINELVSNALEHAFPIGYHPCHLQIELSQEGPQVTLTIADSGRGIPRDFNLATAKGLGLRIARTLAEKDLAGSLRLERHESGGTVATVTFYQ
jgi:two-component sensor histidine kinase